MPMHSISWTSMGLFPFGAPKAWSDHTTKQILSILKPPIMVVAHDQEQCYIQNIQLVLYEIGWWEKTKSHGNMSRCWHNIAKIVQAMHI